MAQPIAEFHDVDAATFRNTIVPAGRPAVLRGLAADWPLVRAADPAAYLAARVTDAPVDMLVAPAEARGRFFYDDRMEGLTFRRYRSTLETIIAQLREVADDAAPPAIAAQSVALDDVAPALPPEQPSQILPSSVRPRLWIGNRVVVATHHDMFANIAVVGAGRRRFTLFPPDQVGNLYIGPFEFTPAGTPVSLVDLDAPDLDRFPRFADALAHAVTAELGPGDAIYIPYMWWHHVRSLDAFNLLVNYWWDDAPPAQPGLAPVDALVHALLAFSGIPAEQRAAWAGMFQHLVFDEELRALSGVPADKHGIRGALKEESKAHIRRQLGSLMAR
jgi:hypothetical protein